MFNNFLKKGRRRMNESRDKLMNVDDDDDDDTNHHLLTTPTSTNTNDDNDHDHDDNSNDDDDESTKSLITATATVTTQLQQDFEDDHQDDQVTTTTNSTPSLSINSNRNVLDLLAKRKKISKKAAIRYKPKQTQQPTIVQVPVTKEDACKKGCCGPKEKEPPAVVAQVPVKEDSCKKGCCGPKEKEPVVIAQVPVTKEDSCKKGCCGPKEPVVAVKEDSCKKGCCPPVSPDISLTNNTNTSADSECKKGCCPPTKGTIVVDVPTIAIATTKSAPNIGSGKYCCDVCITGPCCKKDCCATECCLTFTIEYGGKDGFIYKSDKKKTMYASLLYKACGSLFGLRYGYGEHQKLDETNNGDHSHQDGPQQEIDMSVLSNIEPTLLLLNVDGMNCADCVTTMEDKVKKMEGINTITTNLFTSKCEITFNTMLTDPYAIIQTINSLGFTATEIDDKANELVLDLGQVVDDINISVSNLADDIESIEGVESVMISGDNGNVLVIAYDQSTVTIRTLYDRVNEMVRADPPIPILDKSAIKKSGETLSMKDMLYRLLMISLVLCVPCVLISFILPLGSGPNTILSTSIVNGFSVKILLLFIFSTPIQFYVGKPLYMLAYKTLRHAKKASMDLLVMISSTIAYGYSCVSSIILLFDASYHGEVFFETSSILLTLIILGRYLEAVAKGNAGNVLKSLLSLQAQTSILIESPKPPSSPTTTIDDKPKETKHELAEDDCCSSKLQIKKERDEMEERQRNQFLQQEKELQTKDREIPIKLVQLNDHLRILPFSRIPVDGIIISECRDTLVDESMVTGESVPVPKKTGDAVYGGSMSCNQPLIIKVHKKPNNGTLSNICKMVEQAQSSKPPIQQTADRVASYFVPGIIILSIVVFIINICLAHWRVVDTDGQGSFTFSLLFSITVLVISCPCAISLSAPTAIMVGCGVGAKLGILYKGGDVLEAASKVDTVVFDKTGTLTKGKPNVTDVHTIGTEIDQHTLLEITGSLEQSSEHVYGKMLTKYCREQLGGKELVEATEVESVPGKGIKGLVNGVKVVAGNVSLIVQDEAIIVDESSQKVIESLERDGKTIVVVAIGGKISGIFGMIDEVKEESRLVVQALMARGLKVWILSGDNYRAVQRVSNYLGVPNFIASATPQSKCKYISQIQSLGRKVAFVGDGVNDAVALVQSNVGIAVCEGTDVAIEAASIVLMKDDLRGVVTSIDLSQRILKTIKLNFLWAFLYNLVGIPISSGILYPFFHVSIPVAFAGISELLSSLPVVLFSLLINYYTPPLI
ncbi:P-type ATPase [Cavenderia fasciculata]|uniref:P-type ATPase n=1 Tax=Cavenderia fasciculata TaxID=261658 RepID=F4PGF4_CACFS|nr:P-type ATPase [Cavenderia fasciculata]EGG24788.1 P-type ATPase [Cavenderia fasciculata]|eukprot:XP_004362639.1 P-type ATPase [Cavenderia fasciculata]